MTKRRTAILYVGCSFQWRALLIHNNQLLVYSAATVTGMYTIQQTRVMYPKTFIIALASQQHHDMLKKMGANETFDYKSPSLVSGVRSLGRNITKCVDCFSEGQSTAVSAKCMISNEEENDKNSIPNKSRRIIRTLPPTLVKGSIPPNVRADEWILTYTAFGKARNFRILYLRSLQS